MRRDTSNLSVHKYKYKYPTNTNIYNYERNTDLAIMIIQCQDSDELFSALSPRPPSPPSWRFYMLSVRFMCRKIALISFLRHFSWINTSVRAAASLGEQETAANNQPVPLLPQLLINECNRKYPAADWRFPVVRMCTRGIILNNTLLNLDDVRCLKISRGRRSSTPVQTSGRESCRE